MNLFPIFQSLRWLNELSLSFSRIHTKQFSLQRAPLLSNVTNVARQVNITQMRSARVENPLTKMQPSIACPSIKEIMFSLVLC